MSNTPCLLTSWSPDISSDPRSPPVTPLLAAAVHIPTLVSSFTHSPLVRSVSHLLPTLTATAFPSLPHRLQSVPEPGEDYSTAAALLPAAAQTTRHTHASSTSRRCCTERERERKRALIPSDEKRKGGYQRPCNPWLAWRVHRAPYILWKSWSPWFRTEYIRSRCSLRYNSL